MKNEKKLTPVFGPQILLQNKTNTQFNPSIFRSIYVKHKKMKKVMKYIVKEEKSLKYIVKEENSLKYMEQNGADETLNSFDNKINNTNGNINLKITVTACLIS